MKTLPFCYRIGPRAPAPAFATLSKSARKPRISLHRPATLGAKPFTFHLAEALKKGPVVVYFYPAAFTKGCTVEAHDFAAAMPQYQALGASVIGVSHDDSHTLERSFRSANARANSPSPPTRTAIS